MDDDSRQKVALWGMAVLGSLVSARLDHGDVRAECRAAASKRYEHPDGRLVRVSARTVESWYYAYRRGGFQALFPSPRNDRGKSRSIRAGTSSQTSNKFYTILRDITVPSVVSNLRERYSEQPALQDRLDNLCVTISSETDSTNSYAYHFAGRRVVEIDASYLATAIRMHLPAASSIATSGGGRVSAARPLPQGTRDLMEETAASFILFDMVTWTILHEIAHHELGHIGSQPTSAVHARKDELEADMWAFREMEESGQTLYYIAAYLRARALAEGNDRDSWHPSDGTRWKALTNTYDISKFASDVRLISATVPFEIRSENRVLNLEALFVLWDRVPIARGNNILVFSVLDGWGGLVEHPWPCIGESSSHEVGLEIYCNIADELLLAFSFNDTNHAAMELQTSIRSINASGNKGPATVIDDLVALQSSANPHSPGENRQVRTIFRDADTADYRAFVDLGVETATARKAATMLADFDKNVMLPAMARAQKGDQPLLEAAKEVKMQRAVLEQALSELLGPDVWSGFRTESSRVNDDLGHYLSSGGLRVADPNMLYRTFRETVVEFLDDGRANRKKSESVD